MNDVTLPQTEKAWFATRALRNLCRQNIDKFLAAWNKSAGSSPPGSYHGLLLGTVLASVIVAALAAGAMLAHFTRTATGPYGPYVRLPADFTVLNADIQEASALSGQDARYAPPGTSSSRIGTFSENIRPDSYPESSSATASTAKSQSERGLIAFSRGRVSIETIDGSIPITRLRQAAALAPTPSLDPVEVTLFAAPDAKKSVPALFYGETLDNDGNPTRWAWRNGDYPQKTVRTCDFTEDMRTAAVHRLILGMTMPVPGSYYGINAGRYSGYVTLYAEKYNLTAGLMLAIMHTESNFNPFAVSPNQAVGLMQIVPDTAGNEVYRYLMGTQGTPSMETLFSPEDNIKYGAIYLHLLGRRYFSGVANTASRQMCIIAAYNGGPNAVLRLFDPDADSAVAHINSLTPEQVYAALTTDMPNPETRRYVEVVMDRLRSYSAN